MTVALPSLTPGTVPQAPGFELKPEDRVLVWLTKRQPWPAGQVRLSVPPLMLLVMEPGPLGPPATTLKTPVVGFKLQASPPARAGRLVVVNEPLMPLAALNRVNESPSCNGPPTLAMVSVPPQTIVLELTS